MQRVLVLENDKRTAERLKVALQQSGDVLVAIVRTMREAFLLVSQLPQDLAFISLDDAEDLLHALRALQPGLRMILTTADSGRQMPMEYQKSFQGLLHTAELERELPMILNDNSAVEEVVQTSRKNDNPASPGLIRLHKACEEVGINTADSPVKLVVLSHGPRVVGCCGRNSETDAQAVADMMNENWPGRQVTAHLQYLYLADEKNVYWVYSRAVAGAILSLVAEPDTMVGDMRKVANRLARLLSDEGEETAEAAPEYFTTVGRVNGSRVKSSLPSTFAVAWRPIKPLPTALEKIVQSCIVKLAEENNCRLHHLLVTPELVHIVISCPAGKTAAWVVFLMKSGINDKVQEQFGIHSTIWHKGFYAVESDKPLNKAELMMVMA